VNACVHTYTKPQTSSTRSRGLGRRIQGSVEDTKFKLSTNKQHTLSGSLAEAHELVVDEAILDVVELVDVVHNFLTLFLYKVLDKSVSANGNPRANVVVIYKGRGGEQGTEVCEGGISSEQALCGRVRLGRRDTLDENLALINHRRRKLLRRHLGNAWRGCVPIGDVC
jgi:hypothetical protein